jgi:hypothetical protein
MSKSNEIKEKIKRIKASEKDDILDLESEEVGEESLFSEMEGKAPIQMEEDTKKKKEEGEGDEEEIDDSFRDWIDGLGGASSG